MLQLKHAYAAYPANALHHLLLPQRSLLVYPSADTVIILDASSLALVRVLAFSEAFFGAINTITSLKCVAVDSAMKLIVAATDTRIASWSLSGVQEDTWRIHSTLSLPENYALTTLDSKSGLLTVGSNHGLSVYTLILEDDLPKWSLKWTVSAISPTLTRFAPSLMYITTFSNSDDVIRLYSTTSGRQTQAIAHPRPIQNFSWRHSQSSSRDDLILYTVTADSTIRIFLPVLDSPQRLQLHASLDLFSSLPFPIPPNPEAPVSTAFWLDREVVENTLNYILKQQTRQDDARIRRIKEIIDGGWDLFLRALQDGSVIVTAVANIDRRPPTLLRQFTLQHLPPATLPGLPSNLYVLPSPDPSMMALVMTSPLATFKLSPLSFFDAQSDGLYLTAKAIERVPAEETQIVRLVRTPEGKGVGVIRIGGDGEAWRVVEHGHRLVRSGSWKSADHAVVLQGGRTFATYSLSTNLLTLHSTPPQTLSLPPIKNIFALPSQDGRESIIGITPEFSIVHLHANHGSSPGLFFRAKTTLPMTSPPKIILPVDPMAWGPSEQWDQHDVLLSISETGELAFWVLHESVGFEWRCTGMVRTGRTQIRKASCSSAKKTALIVPESKGDELTIWDSKESEFAIGIEFRGVYTEPILDLDWTSTPDTQSILAVGFRHRIELLCQQRMTYFDEGPGWTTCTIIDIGNFIPYEIRDSIWLSDGALLLAAGHQMFLYGAPSPPAEDKLPSETLFKYVARQNGPLKDYHPQMILQCLLWDKVELVKEIITNLSQSLADRSPEGSVIEWEQLPVKRFLRRYPRATSRRDPAKKRYTSVFNNSEQIESDEEKFSRQMVTDLLKILETCPLPHLTPNEQAHLLTLIQTTLEIDEQRRALDSNGLRYLISMRSFYILNHRASTPSDPESNGVISPKLGRRERIRYRDMIWAFHSESQDLLLNASMAACNGKLGWSEARALGIPIWLTSIETMRAQMELIARNEYMAGDNRDPTVCSLYYFALGKIKLVQGLWRQAAWHKEQAIMLNFLSNDFTKSRWRTAALKNAFVLLSKQRFEYAVAFFLLGNSLKDAVNVCIKQLGDFQLGVALARVVEQSNAGPVLLDILRGTVLPVAFKDGNRWLSSWAFWLLNRKDLAVRVLLTPLHDIAAAVDIQVTEIGEPHYDDPSLALLFSQLRSKTLQTAKGTSEISGRSEFNFVLQMARVFCRMGCHVLALDLVRSWQFDRPSLITQNANEDAQDGRSQATSPMVMRRSLFDRRRSSIMIDMQIPSLPPTGSASPTHGIPAIAEEKQLHGDGDFFARKAGLGNLMKSAKQDVKIPEFDMSSFF